MHAQYVLVALVAAVSAVPLNINLGAYSPALVVGDGEISLGNAGAASELMATLASGAAAGGGAAGQQEEVTPPAEATPPAEGQPAETPAERSVAKRSLGRRSTEEHMTAVTEAMQWIKRDIAGFNAALSYAREAMKDSPKIEMGSEGAGVGIVVNAGSNVAANSAANGAKPPGEAAKKEKRAEVVEESEAPKMTLVAITEV
jgi:hypothetical protein